MSKKSRSRGQFDRQHGKSAQALFKSASQYHYHIHRSLLNKLSWKKSLLLTCKILGLLVNTLAVDEKYLVFQRDNLTRPIQMQLSQQQKNFLKLFLCIFEIYLKFWTFWKLGDPRSFCISKTADSENLVREMPKKSRFRGSFDNQHGKRAQALLKSASQHLYHIHWSLTRKLFWK